MVFSGTSPDGRLVEIAELKDHPFFIGSQFHPEFKSRPLRPHPLFHGFVGASAAASEKTEEGAQEAPRQARRPRSGPPAERGWRRCRPSSGPRKAAVSLVLPPGEPAGTIATRDGRRGRVSGHARDGTAPRTSQRRLCSRRCPSASGAPSSRPTRPRRGAARGPRRDTGPHTARSRRPPSRTCCAPSPPAAALSGAVLETRVVLWRNRALDPIPPRVQALALDLWPTQASGQLRSLLDASRWRGRRRRGSGERRRSFETLSRRASGVGDGLITARSTRLDRRSAFGVTFGYGCQLRETIVFEDARGWRAPGRRREDRGAEGESRPARAGWRSPRTPCTSSPARATGSWSRPGPARRRASPTRSTRRRARGRQEAAERLRRLRARRQGLRARARGVRVPEGGIDPLRLPLAAGEPALMRRAAGLPVRRLRDGDRSGTSAGGSPS